MKFTVPLVDSQGQKMVGIKYATTPKTFSNVAAYSYHYGFSIIKMTYATFFGMFKGQVSVKDVSGPVGIIDVIASASRVGVNAILNVMVLISLNLGVVNLMPLPALDGGRIIFVLYEMITRRRANPKWEGYIHLAGFALLILFMLYVTKNDIVRQFIK